MHPRAEPPKPLPTVAEAAYKHNQIASEIIKVDGWSRYTLRQLEEVLEGPNARLDLLETGARITEEQYEEAVHSLINQADLLGPVSPYGARDRKKTYTPEELSELRQRADKAEINLLAFLADIEDAKQFVEICRVRSDMLKQELQQARLEVGEAQERRARARMSGDIEDPALASTPGEELLVIKQEED